jgi:MSHA pilin protein MshC
MFERGFTMVELVVTMVIIGIMAIAVVPRMDLLRGFDEIGYRDQVKATLEYARKSAVAGRRNVRVQISGNDLVVTADSCHPEGTAISTPPCASLVGTYPRDLILPGSSLNRISPRGNTTILATSTASVVFDPQGRPWTSASTTSSSAASYTIRGESDSLITVEAQTGYVH